MTHQFWEHVQIYTCDTLLRLTHISVSCARYQFSYWLMLTDLRLPRICLCIFSMTADDHQSMTEIVLIIIEFSISKKSFQWTFVEYESHFCKVISLVLYVYHIYIYLIMKKWGDYSDAFALTGGVVLSVLEPLALTGGVELYVLEALALTGGVVLSVIVPHLHHGRQRAASSEE